MKKFEIKSKGSLSQYIKTNAIKAKGEIANKLNFEDYDNASCFRIEAPGMSKGLIASL